MRPFKASLIVPLPHGPENIHRCYGMRWSDAYVQDRRHRACERAPRAAPTQFRLSLEGDLRPRLPGPALLNHVPDPAQPLIQQRLITSQAEPRTKTISA